MVRQGVKKVAKEDRGESRVKLKGIGKFGEKVSE